MNTCVSIGCTRETNTSFCSNCWKKKPAGKMEEYNPGAIGEWRRKMWGSPPLMRQPSSYSLADLVNK